MLDIITFGSATIDSFIDSGNRLVNPESRMLCIPFGEKIRVEDVQTSTGGGGTNTAVAFSRLGLKTAYYGKIGNDHNGDAVLKELKKEKIRTGLLQRGGKTGSSVILDARGHDRTILAFKGCNDSVAWEKIPSAKWVYCSSMMGRSFSTFLKLISECGRRGIKIAFNPSYYQIKEQQMEIIGLLGKIDLLVFNKEEAEALVGGKNVKEMMKKIVGHKVKNVVITDGKNGAWYTDGKKMIHTTAYPTKVVETTGAGDTFASTFLAGMIKLEKPDIAMKLAMVNSASVIQHIGAKNILLSWHEAITKAGDKKCICTTEDL